MSKQQAAGKLPAPRQTVADAERTLATCLLPMIFPPGRARVGTSPARTGSPIEIKRPSAVAAAPAQAVAPSFSPTGT